MHSYLLDVTVLGGTRVFRVLPFSSRAVRQRTTLSGADRSMSVSNSLTRPLPHPTLCQTSFPLGVFV